MVTTGPKTVALLGVWSCCVIVGWALRSPLLKPWLSGTWVLFCFVLFSCYLYFKMQNSQLLSSTMAAAILLCLPP